MRAALHGGNLNGLGDILDDAAKAISSGAQTGALPPSSVNQLINDAVSVITGTPAPVAKPATSSIFPTAIPIGMIALLGLAAWAMSGKSKPKYRRNPGRRRSSRRGRGGGGMDMKNLLLWGGGGLAAYALLLRPGAPLMPSLLAPKPAAALPGGMTPAEQAAIASGVKAAPSIIDSITKLFGGGSTAAPTTTTKTATSAPSQFVTDYSQIGIQQPAEQPTSEFVTNYSDISAS
jgi:hypothetical protein